ncbi:Hsp70 family protein, partial [bacterium]|nr:Hsp70 family protein [bacterium]
MSTSSSRYVVGIDLGTTNSALAYVDRRGGRAARKIQSFLVPQLVAPSLVEGRATLPSVAYVLGEHDLAPEQLKLPWRPQGTRPGELVIGELARARGALVPGRLIASSKSWLCHAGVDRKAAILPWGAPDEVPKRSPVDSSAQILSHLRDAWDDAIAKGDETKRLASQELVVTVPASFDEVARELTLEAARRAGLSQILLEEPQAALYSWIAAHETEAETILSPGEQVLVVDVGGGTTDFSLVAIGKGEDGLTFERTAVGDHLLLGGDNMDLALARRVEERLSKKQGVERLDAARWHALAYACRAAKEKLLSDEAPGAPAQGGGGSSVKVVVPGRGSSVIGGALTEELSESEAKETVLQGFFPHVEKTEPPLRRARSGLQEFGLPYVQETAITRHLRAFLARHASEPGALARVDWVLWNGGAMKPALMRERVLEALSRWVDRRPRVLEAESLDLAVSRGAAYYSLVRRGKGTRIKSGAGRAYYVEVGNVRKDERSALCLIPRGLEPGHEVSIAERPLELRANTPAAFPFFGSTVREDPPGELVPIDEDMDELPPVHTVIRLKKRSSSRTSIPVSLSAKLTELGTLELWCQARDGPRRWKLEFDVRAASLPGASVARTKEAAAPEGAQAAEAPAASAPLAEEGVAALALDPHEDVGRVLALDPERVARGCGLLREAFSVPAREAQRLERLGRELEAILERPREAWPVPAIRALFD